MTAFALADQGTLYVGTFSRPMTSTTYFRWFNNFAGNPTACQINWTNFPLDENRLLLTDPRTSMVPAKDGAYVPIRLAGPQQPFVQSYKEEFGRILAQIPAVAGPTYVSYGSGPAFPDGTLPVPTVGRYPYVTGDVSGPAGETGSPFWQSAVPANAMWCVDSGYDNINHTLFIFRGLSSTASITFKCISGLEVIPRVDSPVLQFTSKPVKYSPNALAFYQAVSEEMRMVYPSSFNSLGTILSAIGSAASRIWPVVRSIGSAVVPVLDKALGAPEAMSDRQVVTTTARPGAMGTTVQAVLKKTMRRGRRATVRVPQRSASRSRTRSRSVRR